MRHLESFRHFEHDFRSGGWPWLRSHEMNRCAKCPISSSYATDGELFWGFGFGLLLNLGNRSGADDAHPFQDYKEHAARDERDNYYQHDSSHVFRSGSNGKDPIATVRGPRKDVSRSLAS